MPIELRVVLGVSGAFILLFIFIAGQIGSAAELAAKTLF
jgi:NADH-quinone oxidoreductase subunit N